MVEENQKSSWDHTLAIANSFGGNLKHPMRKAKGDLDLSNPIDREIQKAMMKSMVRK